jgi:hypothetical protein
MVLRRAFLLSTGLTVLISTQSTAADNFSDLVKSMSQINGVPEATVLSDLMTKNAGNAIQSGLSSGLFPFAAETTIPIRGFQVRPVELDPRFQANVARVLGSINIGSLSRQSPIAQTDATDLVESHVTVSRCANVGIGPPLCVSLANAADTGRSLQIPTSPPQEDDANGRVFGGIAVQADHDAFGDTVALVGQGGLCSGVLVSEDVVITAAHCYCDNAIESVLIGTNIQQPLETISVDKPRSVSYLSCDKVVGGTLRDGDVAVLKLKTKVTKARARAIGDLAQVKAAASVRAIGFGKNQTLDQKKKAGFKYQVDIVIASYQCDGKSQNNIPDPQMFRCQPYYELVAAGLNRDTCNGDSGGPIYVFGDDGQPYVVGITSRGTVPNADCGVGGVYVLLVAPPIRDWLTARGVSLK